MSETKKCRYCQSDIPKKAKVCPVCHKDLRHKGLAIALLIIGILIILFAVIPTDTSTTDSTEETGEYATLDKFNQVEVGMTYDEVVDIMGKEGTLVSETGTDDYKLTSYTWTDLLGIGNATISFENGVVSSKVQLGLQ